jgi:predicted transposase/invertase (TIGR01784 family)
MTDSNPGLLPVGINPRVDCVFRALLADPQHPDRLLDFLQAILERPIQSVQLTNPFTRMDHVGDAHVVVDVLAYGPDGHAFHVEMQTSIHSKLSERMLFGWATLYHAQIERGEGYLRLRPVVSIWLLDRNLFRSATDYHHRFRLRDQAGLELSSDLEIHVIELDRWRAAPDRAAAGGWIWFFAEAEMWPQVPVEVDRPTLESAMSVLTDFQQNAARNDLYRSRLQAMMLQATLAQDAQEKAEAQARQEALEAELAAERAEKERERAEKERERAEKERAVSDRDLERAERERERAEKESARAELAKALERLRAAGLSTD